MAKKSDSPWDPETEEMIRRSQMEYDLGIINGIRQPRPQAVKSPGSSMAKRASTDLRKRTSGKRTARQEALRILRETGRIPASPTR